MGMSKIQCHTFTVSDCAYVSVITSHGFQHSPQAPVRLLMATDATRYLSVLIEGDSIVHQPMVPVDVSVQFLKQEIVKLGGRILQGIEARDLTLWKVGHSTR
jgi:hypothetical protein